ncbi:MAG: K(+)-transporting ATPase subunit F [Marinilabiliales bacterium]|nr:K(+)-transporting ATPase subunit F [Marinilabiliales bacterium]
MQIKPFISLSFMAIQNPGYLIGATLALLLLGYLIYALIKPEKF